MLQKFVSILDNDAGWYKLGICCGDVVILLIGLFYGTLCGAAVGTTLAALFDAQSSFFIYFSWVVFGILGVLVASILAYVFHNIMMMFDNLLTSLCAKLRF